MKLQKDITANAAGRIFYLCVFLVSIASFSSYGQFFQRPTVKSQTELVYKRTHPKPSYNFLKFLSISLRNHSHSNSQIDYEHRLAGFETLVSVSFAIQHRLFHSLDRLVPQVWIYYSSDNDDEDLNEVDCI